METKGFFHIEIIINVLVSYVRFIWIPVLWVYGHYKYIYSYSAGIDFRRQILTSKVDPRSVGVSDRYEACIFITWFYMPWHCRVTHLKLFLATATDNFKWMKITHICLIWDQSFANIDVQAYI